jgi:beta-glucosidase
VHDCEAKLVRPYKELKGFAKVALEPGETKTVTIELGQRAFAYYNPAYRDWVTESGEFDILVGRSAADICLTQTVEMTSTQQLPCILHKDSTIREWFGDPRGAAVLGPVLQEVMMQMPSGLDAGDALGMGLTDFVQELPLTALLGFFGRQLPVTPEKYVDDLLAKIER